MYLNKNQIEILFKFFLSHFGIYKKDIISFLYYRGKLHTKSDQSFRSNILEKNKFQIEWLDLLLKMSSSGLAEREKLYKALGFDAKNFSTSARSRS